MAERSQRVRRYTQLMAAVLYNCNFKGFAEGKIYKGDLKGVCTPGLNCYSCPGAVAACPLGSLQTALVNSRYRFPYYILGTLLLLGLFLGRFICGFLCPVGLIQELLHKIPVPKLRKSRVTRVLSYGKYIVLGFFVIVIPLWKLAPGFCKYICPAGTFEAGIPLTFKNEFLRKMTGSLFTWKVFLLIVIGVASVFIFRSFCRFLCPLGAIYSFFNPVSVFGVRVDPTLCTNCDACVRSCPMDIRKVRDRECIQCGQCIGSCPTGAIHFGFRDRVNAVKLSSAGDTVSVSGNISSETAGTSSATVETISVLDNTSSGTIDTVSVLGDTSSGTAETVSLLGDTSSGTVETSSATGGAARRKILLAVSALVLLAGIIFLVIGLRAGGFKDMMKKAIRICYECIGIG